MSDKPFYRHQVHEIPAPRIDITEYRLYSGKCAQCGEAVKAQKPSDIPQGIMGPNLMSQIAILAGQYHLSVRKIRSLLQEQFGTTFSVGAISEAQSRIASMLTPLHQAIKTNIQSAPLVHVDETSHSRNDEKGLRWCWLVASEDLVYEKKSFTLVQCIQQKRYWTQTIVALWSVTNIAVTTGFLRTDTNSVGRMSFAIYNKLPITQAKGTPQK